MEHGFDATYWTQHWSQASGDGHGSHPAQAHLAREVDGLTPGTALDAGCGAGAEAIWLAERGWRVVAADIAAAPLARGAERAARAGLGDRVEWVEADLTVWEPAAEFDLVTTHYAHPAMPQLAFYERIARWVAPGGTLLIVGHLHSPGHGHHPAEASVTVADIVAGLDRTRWKVVTAEERLNDVGHAEPLRDAVVRAVRVG
ncbi:hypothetical protein Asp14428_12250 [Actinoplanes sp. NBRC 14428]|uniref:Methyltransferase family protein n=1 Tax=Pseudosporangium ferrugineum TaxID=439699 RepID=A0A2T0SF19_9ACTN|nr:class I SAM-dependent methyltransferase [Pseudosporangium ferrugineum]PRY32012.1 methyltransferase family protein [Pseudosporangium ferrugineum]BCJ49750.1 hypothetical protein Asp14428_12250 [Actinoplanes sp. NBRC 14428]